VPSTQELTGKVAVVTGASSGIGRAIAERLGAARAHVYLAGRTESAMQASKERIESNGGRATIATGDLRDPAKVQALVEQAARETGRLDIMVNNSGVSLPAPIIDADPEGWREMLELNILALLAGLPRRALRGDSADRTDRRPAAKSSFSFNRFVRGVRTLDELRELASSGRAPGQLGHASRLRSIIAVRPPR
jgi:NAD(P)-dependent dehydrogenase (short-subunit alcohol dehydrogenase family)